MVKNNSQKNILIQGCFFSTINIPSFLKPGNKQNPWGFHKSSLNFRQVVQDESTVYEHFI
jgi:hypothetical protein